MSRICSFVLLLVLTACSAKETGDGAPLVKATVSSSGGAMIFHDGDPVLVLSIPPAAVSADVEISVSALQADVGAEALSPVIVIAPEATTLSFPGSLSIAVKAPTAGMVIARVTDTGLERLPGSSVDATTGEIQAQLQRLGRFVVVDSVAAALAEPGALDIVGTWQGTGQHQAFALKLFDSKFRVSKDGRVVREGSYSLSGNSLSLIDSNGSTEAIAVKLNVDELTFESANSGVVRWQRMNSTATTDAAPTGFFAVAQSPEQAPTKANGPPRNATDSLANTPSSSADTQAGTQKKGFFQRIGNGVKSATNSVVRGVKNVGKSNGQQTQTAGQAPTAQQLAGTCDQILGDWKWFIGGKVSFVSGGRVRWTPAVSSIPPAVGTWSCVEGGGTIVVTWQNGYVDTLNLADDGIALSGTSSNGAHVSGQRVSGVVPAATSQNASDGWTPIGTGGFGQQGTVPIGPNGPQRIGPEGRPPPKGAG